MQLLAPAHEALSNPCLTGPITEYPWVEGISLITIFVMCFLQLMTMHYVGLRNASQPSDSSGSDVRPSNPNDLETSQGRTGQPEAVTSDKHPHDLPVPKKDSDKLDGQGLDTFAVQLTSVFVLEFGVIFHSVLIGLTLAVAGEEFKILFIVLVFHQTFEGLGIGSRLATIPWPESRKWTPLILGLAYGLSTPVAIGIGLGVRNVYPPESRTALIVSGVFDSISAGILIYASLVELIAHEIVFSDMMRRTSPNRALRAFSLVCLGAGQSYAKYSRRRSKADVLAGLMALLGRWA